VAEPTLWERVDEPVLRWVASLPPSVDMESYRLELREPESFDELPDVTMRNPRSDQT
jgi:hypothetical protein